MGFLAHTEGFSRSIPHYSNQLHECHRNDPIFVELDKNSIRLCVAHQCVCVCVRVCVCVYVSAYVCIPVGFPNVEGVWVSDATPPPLSQCVVVCVCVVVWGVAC